MADEYMQAAIAEAETGAGEGGIPIGAVLVHGGRIIGRGHNRRVQRGSAVLHGEMDALENAGRQSSAVYRESVLYTTLSPCAMCSGAVLLYGIPKVIVGENRTFLGEEALLRSRGVDVQVLQDPACIDLMRRFIRDHPGLWNEDTARTRAYTLTVTRRKVAGITVLPGVGLLFSRSKSDSSSRWRSSARPAVSAAAKAFIVGP